MADAVASKAGVRFATITKYGGAYPNNHTGFAEHMTTIHKLQQLDNAAKGMCVKRVPLLQPSLR
ncbi:MAG: hypothetical protein FRX49_08751 [Trebouxia sp. A1-2]|nr:MAG: hypothetical protein FRX49_08751 [Trebouxia sp. A1-2]